MRLTLEQRLVLGRLTDDAELLALLQLIDADRAEFYQNELVAETQSTVPNSSVMVQLGAKLAERKKAWKLYLDVAGSQTGD